MLKRFRDQLAAASDDAAVKTPPFVIKASDLDGNFSRCHLLPTEGDNAPYVIERTSEDGYTLRGTRIFDVCENGKPVKYLFFASRVPTTGEF